MILHADGWDPPHAVAEVCVVGSGPVGLQLAMALADKGVSVLLLESGELFAHPRSQDLNAGISSGKDLGTLRSNRVRQFGGTMTVWGGNCRRLDPIDFTPRSHAPHSGWPIRAADLEPYCDMAAHAFGIADEPAAVSASPRLIPRESGFEEIAFSLSRHVNGLLPQSAGTFGEIHFQAIRQHRNLRLVTGATVVALFASDDRQRITSLLAMSLRGKNLTVYAKAFVLCAGGIENARLLLASDDDFPAGLGNDTDQVGRCFMEHPHGLAACLVAHRSMMPTLDRFSPGRSESWGVAQRRLRLTEAQQETSRTLQLCLQLVREDIKPDQRDVYQQEFDTLERGSGIAGVWQRYYLVYLAEQAPNRESRVTLAPSRDFFHTPHADVHWRLSAIDHRTVYEGVGMALERIFVAPLFHAYSRVEREVENWTVGFGAHHMGTTRMSALPSDGVVDRDCRIHGMANCYLGGSSVFPTSGMANPTFTAVALALRLADTLIPTLHFLPDPEPMPPRIPRRLTAVMA